MSDIIKLLPDSIANQIAAGEVIQRPASAVKEMVENAIDAGATTIQLIVKDAGKILIQVIDNGKGMSETDARMCFERHATSKITDINDLFSIRTKGFRGEAMPSIAAVAQVELKSRTADQEMGTKIIIEGSKVISQEACQTPVGTSIAVKNLFYNVPARRNFLKSNPVEMKHILNEFYRLSLAHSDIFFTLHSNGQQVHHLPSANLRKRINGVMGAKYDERLIPLEEETPYLNVSGFIGKPEFARRTRGEQYFFVNQRFIKSNYLNHAVISAYEDLLQKDTYPLYVLFLEIDPDKIDVNVHPTKQEIKFEDERTIYQMLRATVKRSLGIHSISPAIDFDTDTSVGFNIFGAMDNARKIETTIGQGNSASSLAVGSPKFQQDKASSHWKDVYEISNNFERSEAELTISSGMNAQSEASVKDAVDIIPFQLHRQYIIFQIKSGYILIDQQSAHQRILFEQFLEAFSKQAKSKQQLLFPHTIELNSEDSEILKAILEDVSLLGYEIEDFGNNAFIMRAVPADLEEGNHQQAVDDFIEQFKMHSKEFELDQRTQLAKSLARSAGVKKGKKLGREEMKNMIDSLFACDTPYLSPNGHPTFLTYSLHDLENQFRKKN